MATEELKTFFSKTKKIINLYIFYELDNQPTNLNNKYGKKNCLFGAVKLTRSAVKIKFIYNDYGIAFDESWTWSFGNLFVRNRVIFSVNKEIIVYKDILKIVINNFHY